MSPRTGPRSAAIALILAAAGCAGPRPVPEASLGSCRIDDGVVVAADPVAVALLEPVDAVHAPVPVNDAERLLFRQVYETLVALDCEGAPVPALAASWTPGPGRREITLRLREAARFGDGEPVRAGDVVRSWTRTRNRVTHDRDEHAAGPWERLDADPVRELDATRVAVRFAERPDVTLLVDPAFAVTRRSLVSEWPLGTGPLHIAWEADSLRVPVVEDPRRGGRPRIVFLRLAGVDPRDALDSGIDLLVGRDRSLLAYARDLGYRVDRLPWTRTYVLVTPIHEVHRDGGLQGSGLDLSVSEALARDTARSPARASLPVFGWERAGRVRTDRERNRPCGPPRTLPEPRIAFLEGDPDARSLAERLVALSGPQGTIPGLAGSGSFETRGLAAGTLAWALGHGAHAAFVLGLDRDARDHGADLSALLADLQERYPVSAGDGCRQVVPLVDTASAVVIRPALRGLRIDGLGTPLLHGLGRAADLP